MTQFVISNNVNTQLATVATSSATTLTLASSANLPTLSAGQIMPITLNDAATGLIYEVCYVTAISGVTLTVERAQEGTGAQNWNIGDYAFCAPTQGTTEVTTGNPNLTFMVAPATALNMAPQMAQVSGVVGQSRNLVMNVTAASATATMTADEIIVESALGGLRYCLANFNETINLATTGAGGMDTGSAPVSGFVALYAIYNPTTGAAALLGVNAATKQPNVYGGAHMPAGYTASALVSVWTINSSGQFFPAFQRGREIYGGLSVVIASSATQETTFTAVTASSLPPNALTCSGVIQNGSSSASNVLVQIAGSASGAGNRGYLFGPSVLANAFVDLPIITPQTLYYIATASAGTMAFSLATTGYTF